MIQYPANKITKNGIEVEIDSLQEGDIINIFTGQALHPVMEVNKEGKLTDRMQDFQFNKDGSLKAITQ